MRQNMVDLMDSLLVNATNRNVNTLVLCCTFQLHLLKQLSPFQPVFEDFVRLEFKAATASDSEPLILLKDATAMDIKRRIASLIHAKRDKINRSNQLEFIDQANSKNGKECKFGLCLPAYKYINVLDCARTDAAIIDRSIQMKQVGIVGISLYYLVFNLYSLL